jgi:hypothetical protein
LELLQKPVSHSRRVRMTQRDLPHTAFTTACLQAESHKKFRKGFPLFRGGVGKLGAAEASLLFPPCPDDPEGFATEEPNAIDQSYTSRQSCDSTIVRIKVGMR